MKQFFKMMFASTLGVLLAAGIFVIFSLFILVGVVASLGSSPAYSPAANTVFKLKLSGTLADNPTSSPLASLLGEEENTLSLKDVLQSIQTAKENKHIKGIYVETGLLSTGTAGLESIRRALLDFKESGKFLVAYGDFYSQGEYYVCSVADKVFMNPQGVLELSGLSSQTMFYTGLMKKIGVEMQIFKVGTYKGAVEPFMLEKLSDANREQIQSYIGSIWGTLTTGIAEARKVTADDINRYANEGLVFSDPKKCVELGFIDELKYKPEAERLVKEMAGQSGKQLTSATVEQMKNIPATQTKGPEVAILYAEGEIMPDTPASLYDTQSRITEKVAGELIKLKDDDNVKAVVFRVNSPGGSAFVAEQIWRQVVELKKVKPVVVSMGNYAASGGYYIACPANKIIAEPGTLTGSIGIFGMFPNVTGLLGKLDLTTDIVKTNAYADLGDLSRPMNEGEKALLQAYVERGYQTFVSRCAEGRDMTAEAIDKIGQGRVWTGEQAKEIGLVDELGGIELAVSTAAGLAELETYNVTHVSGNKDFLQELLDKQLGSVKMSIVKSVLGDQYAYFQTLERIQTTYGIQARIPYDMKPL